MACRRIVGMLMVAGAFAVTACAPDEAASKNVPQSPDSAGTPVDTASAKRDSATRPPTASTRDTTRRPTASTRPTTRPPTAATRIEPGSTRLGVYTAAQASEGYDVYLGMCNSCHAGLGNHSGEVFKQRWGDRSLSDLFDYIAEYMPKNDPGTLSPEDNVRVMAYLLKVNGMPAGATALPVEYSALQALWMDTVSTKK